VLPVHDGARPAAHISATAPLPYAPALQAAGIEPARCMFVQPATPRESWWALEQALRAGNPDGALGAVIGWLPETARHGGEADFRALRRLHLLAAQHRTLVFVLRATRHAHAPSPAALRLQLVQHDGRLQVQVLKRRGRPLLDPVALQVHPHAWRSARVAPPAAAEPVEVPAQLAHRSAQQALAQREQRWSLKALFSH
jgi:protein ImuA